MKEVQEHVTDFKAKFSNLKVDEQVFQDRIDDVLKYFDFSKAQHREVLEAYDKMEQSMVKLKLEMRELYAKFQSESDLKFKKLVVLDTIVNQLKQEQEVIRVKRTKEKSN